ncbi:hypothetical protein V8F20_008652 [Naviculisporaceae sp. PSN 640]
MSSSPPNPLPASSSSSASIPADLSHEANITTATAEGSESTTATSPGHGASLTTDTSTNPPAPPSISGSTATEATTTTRTSTTMISASGASSTSSHPPLFPPLLPTHAPPQLSITNANAHPSLPLGPIQAPPHPPNQAPSHPIPSSSSHHRTPSVSVSVSVSGPPPQNQISTPRQIEEARRAVVASISNLVDRELSGRASQLHANNSAIEKQEREISRTLDTFRKDNDKLAKLAADHTKKIKEIGNVQNWAEMLEREFLILEETLRLANRGPRARGGRGDGEDDEESGSWSGSGSYSGSWSGSEAGDGPPPEEGREGMKANGEVEGVNGVGIMTAPSGEQDSRIPDQEEASTPPTVKAAPVLLGKGKEREGDIQLALAEAMETDLLIGDNYGLDSAPSSSR